MLTVGLTGGFGTGKSTVAGFFKRLGAKVIDADGMAHKLIHKGGKCFSTIVRLLGQGILTKGDLDRKKVAAVVFHDKQKLKKLNAIIHPVVIREIKKTMARYKENRNIILIIDAPLLIEVGLNRLCDVLIVVWAGRQNQIKRITRRMKIKEREALQRINAQMALHRKIRLADMIIDNNGTLTETKREVKRVWQELQKKKTEK